LIPYNPADAAKAPRRTETREPVVWTVEQVRAFLIAAESERLATVWTLAATSGMRRSEMLGLCWSDVDLKGGEARIRQVSVSYGAMRTIREPKTEASRRTVPIAPSAVAALKRHQTRQKSERIAAGPAYSPTGLVFVDELGAALRPNRVSAAFGRLIKDAGLPPLGLHGLRIRLRPSASKRA
jgi:integrase